jgi:hypothetical protein
MESLSCSALVWIGSFLAFARCHSNDWLLVSQKLLQSLLGRGLQEGSSRDSGAGCALMAWWSWLNRTVITRRLGATLFVAIVLFILALFPFILKYKELFVGSVPNPQPPTVRFVLAMQEWLLIGVTLSATASLNWFESNVDGGLRAASSVFTALSFIGGLLCLTMFAYYRSRLDLIAQNLSYFEDEIPWIFATVVLTILCFFFSVLQTRREKDLFVADTTPLTPSATLSTTGAEP